jgi:hypothetical protein
VHAAWSAGGGAWRALLRASAPATGGVLARVAHSVRVSAAAGNACAFDDRARAAGLRHTSKAECRHACARVPCSGASYIAGVARRAFLHHSALHLQPHCVASATTLRRICNHIASHLQPHCVASATALRRICNRIASHLQAHCVASATTLRRICNHIALAGSTQETGADCTFTRPYQTTRCARRLCRMVHSRCPPGGMRCDERGFLRTHTRSRTRQRPTRT